jgi:hypothetical protein
MSTPISSNLHRSRARRDYVSGRIEFDHINDPAREGGRRAFHRRTRAGVFGVGFLSTTETEKSNVRPQ